MKVKQIVTQKTIRQRAFRERIHNIVVTLRANKLIARFQKEFRKGNESITVNVYDYRFDVKPCLALLVDGGQITYAEKVGDTGRVTGYIVTLITGEPKAQPKQKSTKQTKKKVELSDEDDEEFTTEVLDF